MKKISVAKLAPRKEGMARVALAILLPATLALTAIVWAWRKAALPFAKHKR